MTRFALRFFLAMSMLGTAACHRRNQNRPAPVAQAPVKNAGDGTGTHGGTGGGGGGGGDANEDVDDNPNQRFHQATVYVDGEPKLALTYNEMPPGVKVIPWEWEPGDTAYHMLVADYLKNLGIDIKQVKETHWYGGRDRVVIITGDEIRKNKDKLFFNFTRELFGKPRVEWRNDVKTNDKVDIITDLAIYIHKTPPKWNRDEWALIDEQGKVIEGIPFCKEAEPRRTVRVNLDGRLVGHIKRNLIEGNVPPAADSTPAETRYSLKAFLDTNKIAVSKIQGVDLITHDERVVRVPAENVATVESLPPQGHSGEITVYVGQDSATAKAINIYGRLAASDRPMRTLTLGHETRRGGRNPQARTGKPQ